MKKTYEKPIVVIAQDVSASIEKYAIHDELFDLQHELEENGFEVFSYNFANQVKEGIISEYIGNVTNYSNLIDRVNSKFINRNVAGIVLASDGLYNTGTNPLYKNSYFPFYVLALGDTVTRRDVAISKVLNNDFVIQGNTFPVEISLSSFKCINENISIKLFHQNKLQEKRDIYINEDNKLSKVNFQIKSHDIGMQKYSIKISNLKDEITYKNNEADFYIEVIDESTKVLLLLGNVHPDVSAFKSSIEKNINYDIDAVHIDDFDHNFSPYQLVVLSGLHSVDVDKLKDFDIPTLVFSRGDIMNYKSLFPSVSFSSESDQKQGYISKNPIFSRFSFSDNTQQLFNLAPPLNIYSNRLNILSNENVISSYQEEGSGIDYPVIFLDELESKKTIAVLAEGFWRIKLYDYKINQNNYAFDEFFNKITKLLILSRSKSRFRVESPKKLLEHEDLLFKAEIYDEIYEPVSNEKIDLEIKTEDGEVFTFVFSEDKERYFLNLGVFEPGNYYWKARIRDSDLIKTGGFVIAKSELEYVSIEANHIVLHQLSRMLEGGFFFKDQIRGLIDVLQLNSSTILHNREKKHGIIDIPWILVILLSFVGFEWVVRRYNGLV
ncbi:MAG: hypothetical protein VX370_01400 [Bacteroidota bacterium]|nr:hypothetical protein [Bacteroidota bacterium]